MPSQPHALVILTEDKSLYTCSSSTVINDRVFGEHGAKGGTSAESMFGMLASFTKYSLKRSAFFLESETRTSPSEMAGIEEQYLFPYIDLTMPHHLLAEIKGSLGA